MPRCNGCGSTFRTGDGLESHLSQKRFKRCRAAYHSSDGLLEQYGLASDDSMVTVDPAGDYYGEYDSYTQDDIADRLGVNVNSVTPEAMAPDVADPAPMMEPFGDQEDGTTDARDAGSDTGSEGDVSDLDELVNAAASLECEGGWEPDVPVANVETTPLSSSAPPHSPDDFDGRSPSPPLLFTPSPPSSRSSSPSLVLSDSDMESDTDRLPRNTPYSQLFKQEPFVDLFPNPSAGSPLPDEEQSANSAYQARMGGDRNPYFPFADETDWLVARWAKLRGPSSTALTELLQIPGVR
jgi:hypothetical protein